MNRVSVKKMRANAGESGQRGYIGMKRRGLEILRVMVTGRLCCSCLHTCCTAWRRTYRQPLRELPGFASLPLAFCPSADFWRKSYYPKKLPRPYMAVKNKYRKTLKQRIVTNTMQGGGWPRCHVSRVTCRYPLATYKDDSGFGVETVAERDFPGTAKKGKM